VAAAAVLSLAEAEVEGRTGHLEPEIKVILKRTF
jgi:hypothetical protein